MNANFDVHLFQPEDEIAVNFNTVFCSIRSQVECAIGDIKARNQGLADSLHFKSMDDNVQWITVSGCCVVLFGYIDFIYH